MSRPVLPASRITESAQRQAAARHAAIVERVITTVASDAVVVVGMKWNPHVRKARVALDEAQIPHTYLEFGSYLSMWSARLSIKIWSGWATFPQVFVNGTLIGGHSDLVTALNDGMVRKLLDAARAA